MNEPALTYLSLFSGIGGLDLGLDRAGWTCVGQVEIDPYCRSVLARHWPEVPRHDDVRTAAAWWMGRGAPAPVLVAGGFPCQPVSSMGKRRAQDDPRWGWPWFADVVRALGPRYVLVENVVGLLDAGFGDVLAGLSSLGFDAEWSVLSACAFGAPHTRERLFVLAYPEGTDGFEAMQVPAGVAVGCSDARAEGGSPGWSGWLSEPEVRGMAHGPGQGMGGGGVDADAEEGRSAQAVPVLPGCHVPEAFGQRPAGGPRCLSATPVLQPSMHGEGLPLGQSLDHLYAAFLEECMRVVRENQTDRRSPHGRGSDEQLAGELAHAVSAVSHQMALGEREAVEAAARTYVHRLREAFVAVGALRNASQPLYEAWFALPGETQGWIQLATRGGPWVAEWPDTPRVAHGAARSVGFEELTALGNAVVPAVAEHLGWLIRAHAHRSNVSDEPNPLIGAS